MNNEPNPPTPQPTPQPSPNKRPPVWHPEQRRQWLASKNCPEHFNLVTTLELAILERNLLSQGSARKALQAQVEGASAALGEFFTTQPDLIEAAHEANFRANTRRIGLENALAALDYTLTALQTLANLTDGGMDENEAKTVQQIIDDAANKLGATLNLGREQQNAKREVTPPPAAPEVKP